MEGGGAGLFKSAFARDMLTTSTPRRRDAVRELMTSPRPRPDANGPWSRDADVELARAKQECARLSRENAWLREAAAHEPGAQSLAWRLRMCEQGAEMLRRVLREVAAFLQRAAHTECNSSGISRAVAGQVTWPRVRRAGPCCHDQQVAAEAFRLLRTVQSLLGTAHAHRDALAPVEEVTASGHDESGFSSMSSFLLDEGTPPSDERVLGHCYNIAPSNRAIAPDYVAHSDRGVGLDYVAPSDHSVGLDYVAHSDRGVGLDYVAHSDRGVGPDYVAPSDRGVGPDYVAPSDRGVGPDYVAPSDRVVAPGNYSAEVGLPRFQSGLPSRARPHRSLSFSLPPRPVGQLRQSEDFASLRVLWV